MALIDLHCHLDLFPDPERVVKAAVDRGVYILSVTTTPTAFEGTRRLAKNAPRIRTALGLHPELAAARQHELPLFETLLAKTAYVGEVGLDGSRPHRATLDRQTGILMDILMMCARAGGRTISIHSREARRLVLDLLAAEPMAGRPVLHWFTGTASEVRRAAELGCWFSVGPAMLQSSRGRASAAEMPRERILPETDGPFAQVDGKLIHPWDAMRISRHLAELWSVPSDVAASQLRDNFRKLSALSVTRTTSPA
jgi:TatD DNase family protein